jgi:type IV pilus assembly protein pilZ
MAGDIMSAEAILKIGQRLAFFSDASDEKYTSRIEDLSEKEIVAAMPMDRKRRPIIPIEGQHLYGMAFANECQYRFFSVFHKKGMNNNIPCWWISKPEKLERFQNRAFVRVRVNLPIQVQAMDQEGGFLPPQMTQVIDISGSGVSFVFDRALPIESQVIMEVHNLPEIGTLQVMGRVMRCSTVELDDATKRYQIGVRMLNLTRPIRNRLVRYIFEVQRQELAKGVGLSGGPT